MSSGYTQYPDDYAKDIFQRFYAQATTPSQLVIHREGNLMYYGYIRKLDNSGQYIGFCVLINGVMFTQVAQLFNVLEDRVTGMAASGEIIHMNETGDVVASIYELSDRQREIERVISEIQVEVSRLSASTVKLPSVNYGIANDISKSFSIHDNADDIIDASGKYAYTYIYKEENPDTPQLMGYRSVIKKLHAEKVKLTKEFTELKKKYDRLNEQKKQYKKVVFLCILIVVGIIGLFLLKDSLDNTRSNLADAHRDIVQKEDIISKKNSDIRNLNDKLSQLSSSLSSEKEKREKAEENLKELKEQYGNYLPVIITDVEIANVYNDGTFETNYGYSIYSSRSMYVKPRITYTGIRTDENITLRIKLYTPSGLSRGSTSPSDCSWTESFNVNNGSNTQSFQGWGGASMGHWTSGTYRYEFWYGNICLKAKSFTIY